MNKIGNRILDGGPREPDVSRGAKSLGEFCMDRLKEHGDNIITINGITSEETTVSQILALSIRVAHCLTHYGIKPGDCIGISSENSIEMLSVTLGAFYIGAVVFQIDRWLKEGEIHHVFKISPPRVLFVTNTALKNYAKVATMYPTIEMIYVFGNYDSANVNFQNFISNSDVAESSIFVCITQDIYKKLAIIALSSGTTGLPKVVAYTQLSIISYLSHDQLKYNGMTLSNVDGGTVSILFMLDKIFKCIKFVILPNMEVDLLLRCIEVYKVESLFITPSFMAILAKSPLVDNYDFSSIKMISYAGDSVSRNIYDTVRKRLNISNIRQGYGITETFIVTSQITDIYTIGSVGVLIHGVWGKVVNPKTGDILGPNEHGELMFKSNCLMKEYLGNPDATRAAFDFDGFYRTGDIGYYNEQNEWFITDRMKSMIYYQTEQVPPTEIESILLKHPKVHSACVVGKPDEDVGELATAFVVKNGEVTEEELVAYVAEQLSVYKQLHGGVRFIAEIPRNLRGKVIRHQLKALLINEKLEKIN